jgi:hypothetical protein
MLVFNNPIRHNFVINTFEVGKLIFVQLLFIFNW